MVVRWGAVWRVGCRGGGEIIHRHDFIWVWGVVGCRYGK